MSNTKFNLLAEEIGTHAMVRLCRAFLIENRNTLPLRCELTADEALDPMNCPLHSKKMTGSLCYSPTENGEHPDGAPPCHGCSIGITEAAHEGVVAAVKEYRQKGEGHDSEGVEESGNFLPVGAHLLPEDFKEALRRMHMDIQEKVGYWFNRANSNAYKKLYPESSRLHKEAIREMSAKYPEALHACKAFQAESLEDGSAMRVNGVTPDFMMRNHCVLPYECECEACSLEKDMAKKKSLTCEENSSFLTPTPILNYSYFS